MPVIRPERVIEDLRRLAEFGKVGTGVDRTAFSAADAEARLWLAGRMRDAGLDAAIDGVGNVFGRAPRDGPAILVGSHTDSVPQGGWLDGALGVIYALEIARAALEASDDATVDVVSFQDEEGTFFPCLGSRSFCREVDAGELVDVRDRRDGRTLAEAIAAQPYGGNRTIHLDPSRHRAFLEAHIEQGPRLEAAAKCVGVVTAIFGIRQFRLDFAGRADHAGTTPVAMRHDAVAAAIRLGAELLTMFEDHGGADTVWNIGNFVVAPGAVNVVPASVVMTLEFRETGAAPLDALEARLRDIVERHSRAGPVTATCERTADIPAARMDAALASAIEGAASELSVPSMAMPSGAGHDAMFLARHLPSAMLFVPSIGGRSHQITEDTAEADIIDGCRVLAAAVDRLAGAEG